MPATSLYTFVDLFARQVVATRHLLAKGAGHAAANGVAEREMLGWRLIDDMHPLSFQLMVVINFSTQWTARAAGLPEQPGIEADLDADTFQAAIDDAKAFLATLTSAQFEGRDEVMITHKITDTMEPTLSAAQWLTVFATTNIYFHISTAYGILRAHGVPLGKIDMFASGL